MQRHGGSARWYLPHDTCANYHIRGGRIWLGRSVHLEPLEGGRRLSAMLAEEAEAVLKDAVN